MLRHDIEPGESVELPGIGTIRCIHKSGRRTRLEFDFPASQKVVVVKAKDICQQQMEDEYRVR